MVVFRNAEAACSNSLSDGVAVGTQKAILVSLNDCPDGADVLQPLALSTPCMLPFDPKGND